MDTSRAKRVLIIDDDIYTSDMYAINLRSTGYEVDVALTGNDGYNKLTSNDYDVVLLDLILPGLSGTEILHRWRQTMPKGTRPPIIVLTNYEQNNFCQRPRHRRVRRLCRQGFDYSTQFTRINCKSSQIMLKFARGLVV